MPYKILILLFTFIFSSAAKEIVPKNYQSVSIYKDLKKLNVLGSVLYIAAHPDDENTAVIATMANRHLYRTAYLSITRGDGGQNLLGSEKGEALGILRTHELLSARELDGGLQFFSRAVDFGYSKSVEETFDFWGKEEILSDVVWVIRNFRPDVIITRFTPERGGHGHHRASAVLAQEAFAAAANPARFPEQLKFVETWQPKRLLWNAWQVDPNNPDPGLLEEDLGVFDAMTGISAMEIAARARSMHKSQGFGVSPVRGTYKNYFEHTLGEPADKNLFDGIQTGWDKYSGGEIISAKISKIIDDFDFKEPGRSVKSLIELHQQLNRIENPFWVEIKKAEIEQLIVRCSGLWIESVSDRAEVIRGDSVNITTRVINRGKIPVAVTAVETYNSEKQDLPTTQLKSNLPEEFKTVLRVAENEALSQPFWLKQEGKYGRFEIENQSNIGLAVNQPQFKSRISLIIDGFSLEHDVTVKYKWNDAVQGELQRDLVVVPAVSAEFARDVYIFPNNNSQKIEVTIYPEIDFDSLQVVLELPQDWFCYPATVKLTDIKKNAFKKAIFTVTPSRTAQNGTLGLKLKNGENIYNFGKEAIDYSHIQKQVYMKKTEARLIVFPLEQNSLEIGYVMGSGDDIPEIISQLGYSVSLLTDDDLKDSDLSGFDAIVFGVRAFNTREILETIQPKILNYVNSGGTWIVQHNTFFGFRPAQIGPYPFKISRDRISDETAPMSFILPDHKLLNYPNKISPADFENWVQERGLYFAGEWDQNYQALLSGNDPGENPLQGGLLYCNYGKGQFIYTGLSFFRQLPAGVPGAIRLFTNMLSAGS